MVRQVEDEDVRFQIRSKSRRAEVIKEYSINEDGPFEAGGAQNFNRFEVVFELGENFQAPALVIGLTVRRTMLEGEILFWIWNCVSTWDKSLYCFRLDGCFNKIELGRGKRVARDGKCGDHGVDLVGFERRGEFGDVGIVHSKGVGVGT